jgi:hypothetical protein
LDDDDEVNKKMKGVCWLRTDDGWSSKPSHSSFCHGFNNVDGILLGISVDRVSNVLPSTTTSSSETLVGGGRIDRNAPRVTGRLVGREDGRTVR